MQRSFWVVLAAACYGSAFLARGTSLDPNFRETPFATADSQVTGIAWAPDGSSRLFVSRKGGVVQIVKDGAVLPTPFVTVSPLYTASECGLIGICFDPNFALNGYVYLFATVSGSAQEIIRYTAAGDLGTSKTVLVSNLPTAGANHDGGAVGVGADGKLYWAIGDNGNGTGVDANLTSLASKVGRANLDGSVPADNPFADGPGGNNDYIWARGFRNPFTFTFQPDTGALWVNCVGTLYEQIFLVNAGDHAGWNDYENNQPAGFITPKIKYRTNGTDTRNLAAGSGAVRAGNLVTYTTTAAHGFRQGEKITIAGVADSSFNGSVFVAAVPSATTFTATQPGADATSGGGTATTLNQGGAVSGGCFYDSTAVPAAYRGNFIYGDYNSGRIMRATLSPSNTVLTVDYFVTGSASQIDIAVGPDGALYYAELGGTIRRLAYTNFTSQEIIVTPTVVRMVEGGEATVTICLAMAPESDVTVNVAHLAGDTSITVAAGTTLTFGVANWSVPQVVRLQAATDSDATNDMATLTVSASGLASQTVAVHALNVSSAPVLGLIGDRTVAEQVALNFTANASDADLPPNSLTYSLAGAPAGAGIHPTTGAFNWTPSEAQGPGIYTFDVVVSDGALSDSETIEVTVEEVNEAPVLGLIGNQTVVQQETLSFTANASDVDLPPNTLTYSLREAPAGAGIHPTTGAFNWTPSAAQTPGSYTFDVVVSDGTLSESETIHVTIEAVDGTPVLGQVTTGTGTVQVPLSGRAGKTYVLEGSTDLMPPWISVSTNTLTSDSTNILDSSVSDLLQRFYRARLVP